MPDARTRQTPIPSASNAVQKAKALQSMPALAQTKRKDGAPPLDDQSVPTPARSQAKLITLDDNRASTFTVPAADLDEWWRKARHHLTVRRYLAPPHGNRDATGHCDATAQANR